MRRRVQVGLRQHQRLPWRSPRQVFQGFCAESRLWGRRHSSLHICRIRSSGVTRVYRTRARGEAVGIGPLDAPEGPACAQRPPPEPVQVYGLRSLVPSVSQNRSRAPSWIARVFSCDVTFPKFELLRSVTGSDRFTRLSALNASTRNSVVTLAVIWNFLETDKLTSA